MVEGLQFLRINAVIQFKDLRRSKIFHRSRASECAALTWQLMDERWSAIYCSLPKSSYALGGELLSESIAGYLEVWCICNTFER